MQPPITRQRLHNQQISFRAFTKPCDVVRHLVALQAQDYQASQWAIGLRTNGLTVDTEIEQEVSDRQIIRTWPMRGTLHWVAAEDARWLLKLLTPRVIKSFAGRYRDLHLTNTILSKSRKLTEKALQEEQQLTRTELYRIFEQNGISTDNQRGYHILCYLAQQAVICFGERRGKHQTFVLFDEWVKHSKDLQGEEALAELAARYITSRGPVTVYDFSYWSGLKVTSARKAFHIVEDQFVKKENDGHTYWLPESFPGTLQNTEEIYLLPSFDEMICGYKDRSATLPSEHQKSTILRNGIIRPTIIQKEKVTGIWKRKIKKETIRIETEWFEESNQPDLRDLVTAGRNYGQFRDLQVKFP